jgi:8-oxo-dGTP pyrophosphatase MutT (NUDIX family)
MARELKEEIGRELEVGALCALIEVHFTQQDVRYEEIGLYFNVDPGDLPGETFHGSEGDEVLEFTWFRTSELGDLDIRPKCLIEVLVADDDIVRHLVEND